MREHPSPKNHHPLPHPQYTQLFLGLASSPHPRASLELSLSLCVTDVQMTSTHVPLLSVHLFLSVSRSSDVPLSWLSCSGISSPSRFLAASSTSQTRARLIPSSVFSCLSLFIFPFLRLSSSSCICLPTPSVCQYAPALTWSGPIQARCN